MLHLIQDYAKSRRLASEPGYSTVNIRFLITFTAEGTFASVSPLGEDAKGRTMPGCPQFSLPELKAMGTGSRHFLVDSVDVVALLTKNEDDPDEKLQAKHAGFLKLLKEAGSVSENVRAVAEGLPQHLSEIQEQLRAHKAKLSDKATFAITSPNDSCWLLQDDSWRDWYARLRQSIANKKSGKSAAQEMRCLLTGDLVSPAPTHGKIKGLSDVGGHTSGDILASFKQGSFQHFGLHQAANSAMSDAAVSMYVTGLNSLIRESVKMADRRLLHWYIDESNREVKPNFDPIGHFFRGDVSFAPLDEDSDELPEAELKRLRIQAEVSAMGVLNFIANGGEKELLASGRFVAVSLSANTTRVVVREVREGRFEQLCKSADQWRDDLRICKINGSYALLPSLNRLATCTLRERQPGENYDKWIPAASATFTSLWNAALSPSRQNISEAVAIQAFQRLRLSMLNGEIADALDDSSPTMKLRRSAYYARISLLKLYLSRKGDQPVSDDLDETTNCDAYHAGRMLAVFQHIQTLSSGEPKASFLDRYYSAASTTPYQVLPRIWRIALNHLKRIQPQMLRAELTDLLSEIHDRISKAIDASKPLELVDQFQFQLGFFQQQPHLPNKNTVRRIPTAKGYLVRSKAEATISDFLNDLTDELTQHSLNVTYEPPFLEVAGERINLRPGWVVQTANSGRLLIVEYFGMRDVPQYENRTQQKLAIYTKNNLVLVDSSNPSQDLSAAEGLLVTADSADGPTFEKLQADVRFAIEKL